MGSTHFEEYVSGKDEVLVKMYAIVGRCGIMVKWLLVYHENLLEKGHYNRCF